MKVSYFSPSTLTSDLVSAKVSLHILTRFAGIPNAYIAVRKLVPSYAVICLLKIDKKMVCIDIEFMCFLQNLCKCEHLIDRRFSWTKTTLVGSNDAAQIWF